MSIVKYKSVILCICFFQVRIAPSNVANVISNFEVWDHYFTIGGTGGLILGDMRKCPGFGGEMKLVPMSYPLKHYEGEMNVLTQCLNPAKNMLFAGGFLGNNNNQAFCLIKFSDLWN